MFERLRPLATDDALRGRDSGAVDRSVQRAELFGGGIDGVLDLAPSVTSVRANTTRLPSSFASSAHARYVADHDVGAVSRELPYARGAQPELPPLTKNVRPSNCIAPVGTA